MAYHIAICDDSRTDTEYTEALLKKWAKKRQAEIRLQTFVSAESFLFNYEEDKTWDILLLDIEMGQMDGVEMARRVRRRNGTVQIVFITGYSDYIAEGYDVEALHYLMKPVHEERLFAVLDRAVKKLNLEISGEMVRIPFYEIRYLDVHQNYVTVHAGEDYRIKRTLSDFEKELDSRFVRVGRAMILNLKYIRRVTKAEAWLSDGTRLPLPRGA